MYHSFLQQIRHNLVRWWKGNYKISTSGLTAHACCPYSGITLVRVNVGGGVYWKRAGFHLYQAVMGQAAIRVRVGLVLWPPLSSIVLVCPWCIFSRCSEDGSHTQRYMSIYNSAILRTRVHVLGNGLHRNTMVALHQQWQNEKQRKNLHSCKKYHFAYNWHSKFLWWRRWILYIE